MNFRETITSLTYVTSQTQATGILAPIMRATGHLLYATACIAASEADDVPINTPEEIHNELEAANGHLLRVTATAQSAPVSTACKDYILRFCEAVRFATIEWPEWAEEDRGPNLKDLADRAAALGAFLDAELIGLRGSDPGRSL